MLGIDASLHMIETAGMIHRNNLNFAHMDINKMNFEKEFDLIFSNAALHWVKDHRRLLKNAHKALKTNGKILWDFGGAGNCANFVSVIQSIIAEQQITNTILGTFPQNKRRYRERFLLI